MTTETPDDRPPTDPRVIDLEAEEIRTAADPEPAGQAPQAPPPPRKRRWPAGVSVALLLGLLAGGWLYRDVLSSYLPSDEMTALRNQVEALETNNAALAGQLAAVKDKAEAAQAAAAAAGATAETSASADAGLTRRLDETGKRLADAGSQLAALQASLEALRKSIATAAPEGGGGFDGTALAALGERITALETEVAGLKSAAGAGGQAAQSAALSQALSDLKAKIAAGTPYQAEYDRIARMLPAAAGLDVLAAHAAEGLPDAAGLAGELRGLIASLPQPAKPAAEDDSYFGTLMKSLSGFITIRPIGETDWPRLAEKAVAFAEAGDLTQAIAVLEGGEGERPPSLRQWQERAAARLQLEVATAQVAEAVLRQLTAMGGSGQ
jgi:hypothetical protein